MGEPMFVQVFTMGHQRWVHSAALRRAYGVFSCYGDQRCGWRPFQNYQAVSGTPISNQRSVQRSATSPLASAYQSLGSPVSRRPSCLCQLAVFPASVHANHVHAGIVMSDIAGMSITATFDFLRSHNDHFRATPGREDQKLQVERPSAPTMPQRQ